MEEHEEGEGVMAPRPTVADHKISLSKQASGREWRRSPPPPPLAHQTLKLGMRVEEHKGSGRVHPFTSMHHYYYMIVPSLNIHRSQGIKQIASRFELESASSKRHCGWLVGPSSLPLVALRKAREGRDDGGGGVMLCFLFN